jgi:hypothetical protein
MTENISDPLADARNELERYLKEYTFHLSKTLSETRELVKKFQDVLDFGANEKLHMSMEIYKQRLQWLENEDHEKPLFATQEDVDDVVAFSRTVIKGNPSLNNPTAPFEEVYNKVKTGKMDYAAMRGLYG